MKKFKYIFRMISNDTIITDQNIISFKFINYGTVNVIINNQLYLPATPKSINPNFFDENMQAGEMTAMGYNVVFKEETDPDDIRRQLQCIMKVAVSDK